VSLGPAEILVVLVIALLVFGPTRLPEVGRQVGRAMKEFRKFQGSLKADMDSVFTPDVSPHQEPAPSLPPKAIDASPDPVAESRLVDDAADAARGDLPDPAPPAHDADPAPPAGGADPPRSA